jgi:hypothetical protein
MTDFLTKAAAACFAAHVGLILWAQTLSQAAA